MRLCQNCRWSRYQVIVGTDVSWWTCHYNPPSIGQNAWPRISPEDFCREWTEECDESAEEQP